ncbi:MAG: response regulator transcription factor [Coriobacteriia bacterium]|nr:response regulator transcription factor [Coriobacteriia bacterium]
MRGRILVVDDQPEIREVVRLNLEAEGYEVTTAEDVAHALAAFDSGQFVLAILDVMLPDGDGFDLARSIRERSDVPIMMLSARDTDVDKAVGLGVGADDYVTKPFSPIELVARVKAHLRRYASGGAGAAMARGTDQEAVIEAGPVRIDLLRRRVTVRGTEVELTAKEFDLLAMLAEHPARVYTKAQIYESVWGEAPLGDLSTVQVHVRRLRTKIEEHPDEPTLITTVWGIGYRFSGGAS